MAREERTASGRSASMACADIPLKGGAVGYFYTFDVSDGASPDHLAVRFPGPSLAEEAPLVRIHSECVTGDVFWSLRCDCGPQLRETISVMTHQGGYLLYLRQEGRGIGLKAKLQAYELQSNHHLDTFAANRALGFRDDQRDYGVAAEMLKALGVPTISLITNNPSKAEGLETHGIVVRRIVPTSTHENPHNLTYIAAKRFRGHRL